MVFVSAGYIRFLTYIGRRVGKRSSVLALFMTSLAWMPAWGQAGVGNLEAQSQILQRQQLDLLRADQERALQALPPPGGVDLRQVIPSVPDVTPDVSCRDIHEVIIVGDTASLPRNLPQQIQADYGGRCLGVDDIEAVLATITKRYIEQGHITTRAYLAAQDLRSGTLEITVVEGTIESFELQQQGSNVAKPLLRGAFPVSPGALLNLRDLEQGIEQINSLSSNNATLDIQPGSLPGKSVVVVRNEATRPVHLFTSVDNQGQPSTGKESASATLSLSGVLGLNELIALTHRRTVPDHDSRHATATAARVVVPVAYTTLSYDISESKYLVTLRLPSGMPLEAEGTTLTQSLGVDHVVYRDQARRVSVFSRLSSQRTRSWLGGEFLEISSRKLSTFEAGANLFTQMGGGLANGRFSYVRGIKLMGALQDQPNLPSDYPHAQFEKYTLDVGYLKPFSLGSRPLEWSTQFSGQYSPDTLYGSQQMLLGGASSVRGALVNTLSGDNGYFWRNEIALPWRATTAGPDMVGRLYVGYDIGRVSNHARGVPSGTMTGLTLGTNVQWGPVNLDVFASRTLKIPTPFEPEAVRIGVRLSYSL